MYIYGTQINNNPTRRRPLFPINGKTLRVSLMIPRETIDKIHAAAKIEEVVSDYVTLRKRGANLIGLCPFHNEKTGSFTVSPSKGIYKCFGCGASGHALKFIMEIEQCSFVEAVKQLGKKYHIEVEDRELTAEEQQRQDNRESMFVVNEFANKWFQKQLWETPEGQAIGMSYFHERGLRDDIIRKYQLGYSPEKGNPLAKALKEQGFKEEFITNNVDTKIGVGVVGKSEDGRLYDRFRDRVIFPIFTVSGKPVAFAGRILKKKDNVGKYVNSPDSIIYSKTNELYGLFQAKQAISRTDMCYLVEGQMDVISMHQSGIENVVASGGTALTKPQIWLIKRFTSNITVLYDGDAAGIHAALRGTDMILSEGMNVRVVVLPPEHDPDTFGKEFSVEYVSNYLKENAKDFIRFKTELLLKDAENDPIKRGQVIRDIVETISVIPDNIFRITYVKECSRLLDMPEQTLTNELNKILRAKMKKTLGIEDNVVSETETTTVTPKQEETVEDQLPAGYYQERELVKLLLMYGKEMIVDERIDEEGQKVYEQVTVAQFIIDDLKMDGFLFTNVVNRKIFDIFDQTIDAGYIPDDQFFVSHEDETVAQLAADLLSSPYKLDQWDKYSIFVKREENNLRTTVLSSIYRYKDLIIEDRRKAVEEELKATENLDDQLILLKRKKDLDDIRKQINKELGIVIAK